VKSRIIADELRERGVAAGENRVARLCSQQRIWSVFAKKPGLNRQAGPPVHDDLVDRQFTASAPNVTWLTDITEHWTAEGTLYLGGTRRALSRSSQFGRRHAQRSSSAYRSASSSARGGDDATPMTCDSAAEPQDA
jgi:transposase InsO family protein